METAKTILKFIYAAIRFILHITFEAAKYLFDKWNSIFERSGRNGKIAMVIGTLMSICCGLAFVLVSVVGDLPESETNSVANIDGAERSEETRDDALPEESISQDGEVEPDVAETETLEPTIEVEPTNTPMIEPTSTPIAKTTATPMSSLEPASGTKNLDVSIAGFDSNDYPSVYWDYEADGMRLFVVLEGEDSDRVSPSGDIYFETEYRVYILDELVESYRAEIFPALDFPGAYEVTRKQRGVYLSPEEYDEAVIEVDVLANGSLLDTLSAYLDSDGISLEIKPSNASRPLAVVEASSVNMRSGPGTNYSVLSSGLQGDEFEIIASDANGDWYNVMLADGSTAWLAASIVDVTNSEESIQPAQTIPPSPIVENTATPVPPPVIEEPTAESVAMCQNDMYTCSDLPGSRAQEVYNMCMPISGDIHRLDENNNGIACEDGADFNIAPPPPTEPPPAAPSNVVIVSVDKSAEFVDIQNNGGSSQNLGGWVLVSEKGDQRCSLYGEIAAGQTIRVYALASDSGLGGINCGNSGNIWNNSDSDPAVLYNAAGQEVSRR